MNLAFPPSQKNPAAYNNLDFRTQKNSLLHLARIWIIGDLCHRACVYSTTAVHFQPEGEGWGAERASWPGSQQCFEVVGASYDSGLLLGRVDSLGWNNIQLEITQTFVVRRFPTVTEMIYVSLSCLPRPPGTYYMRWHVRVYQHEYP